MIQKPRGFTQNCIVLLNEENYPPLIMWKGEGSVYRVTQQWLKNHQVTEEHTLYLLKEELEQLLQAAENYEAQGAQDEA